MGNLLKDIRAYIGAIYHNWLALMAGILAIAVWVVGAVIEPMPVSLRWSLLICGVVALVVAGFLAWREERRARLGEDGRLRLLRLIDNGERLAVRLESSTKRQDVAVIHETVAGLFSWREEVERTIKELCPRAWNHFTDVGEFGPDATEKQTRLLVQRIRDVLDTCAPY